MLARRTKAPCFLCDSAAEYAETDCGNSRHYTCSNPGCGEYEISRTAMLLIATSKKFKSEAMARARECRDSDHILEIYRAGPDKVNATPKPRPGADDGHRSNLLS
jgi:hypothetical protein